MIFPYSFRSSPWGWHLEARIWVLVVLIVIGTLTHMHTHTYGHVSIRITLTSTMISLSLSVHEYLWSIMKNSWVHVDTSISNSNWEGLFQAFPLFIFYVTIPSNSEKLALIIIHLFTCLFHQFTYWFRTTSLPTIATFSSCLLCTTLHSAPDPDKAKCMPFLYLHIAFFLRSCGVLGWLSKPKTLSGCLYTSCHHAKKEQEMWNKEKVGR